MHPRQDFTHHVLVPELLARGYAVWTQSGRAGTNDVALLHEQALLDMAVGHVFLRDRGFERVVSVGHSGGGALAAYYIEQASLEAVDRVTDTPGGKAVPLASAQMPVPDGLMMMAPHPGQGQLLLNMIDPSVADETDPLSIVGALDPYSPRNGFRTPPKSATYTAEFIEDYRAAQHRRIERIDAIARQRVERSNEASKRFAEDGDPSQRRIALGAGVIVVHRTDADLRGVDLSLDPNHRPYGSLFGRRPDLTNYGVVGFGRMTTPEAWLSTWSGISSRASLLRCARGVHIPTLLIELTGDQASFPSDSLATVEAIASDDVSLIRVPGMHFGAALEAGTTAGATLAGHAMAGWLGERFPTAALASV
ncbi:alpha/beta hydrolase [Antrihabitans sp. YC2-6]|uniref:alpha/beta hydrolase n=1 Tax=Antrihabitans sp. YC2-6 TaxID=2799498 RepID=UPI001F28FF53|nr:alpha/beta hydrolase [Antrihabitans sp. YC2-6]